MNFPKFDKIFSSLKDEDCVAIFTHPDPDPDAIGACLGIKWLLMTKYGLESKVFMDGDYSARRQNTAMVNILNVQFLPIQDYLDSKKKYVKCIVLDSTEKRLPKLVQPDITMVIDHHNVKVDEEKMEFIYNKQIGACCTLVYEIMADLDTIPGKTETDRIIATAMLEGIRTDTDLYRREDTSMGDYTASAALAGNADMDQILQIERCPLPRYHFELRAEIIKPDNCELVNSTFIGCAGYLSKAKMPSLPILADEIINDMEGINASIIYAIVDDKIELRMRSNDVSVDVNRFLQKHFGDYAGAKQGSGGASLPLGVFSIPNPPEHIKRDIYTTARAVIMTILQREVKSE